TLNGEYWWQNVRMPVRFATAMEILLGQGFNTFLELSPHPVLAANILECEGGSKERPTVLHSLRREEGEQATMRKALASLYVLGKPIRSVVNPDGRFVRLPRYPWQRERYWAESEESLRSRLAEDCHPILGQRVIAALPTWENRLDVRVQRILNDHRVQGHAVLPATAYLEMTVAAAAQFYGEAPLVVEELELARVCFLADEESTAIQVVLHPGESTLHVYARGSDPKKPWNEHASAKARPAPDLIRPRALDLDSIRSRCTRILSGDACYELLKARGLQYGPRFRCIESTYSSEGEALGRIRAPEALARTWDDYRLHPAAMDACLQVIVGLFPDGGSGSDGALVYLPVEFGQVRVHGRIPKTLWSHARLVERDGSSVVADVSVLDDDGRPVVEIRGVRCRAVDEVRGEGLEDLVYEYEWRLSPREGASGGSRPLLPSSRSVAERT
ncbi:MAG: polyketide synthase dehydratase domain-containing protein, partial [Vicinamibacteria bacterium]